MNKEIRSFTGEVRATPTTEAGTTTIEGYAAVFDSSSEDLGGFTEVISPEAFNDAIDNDVRALFNHDPNFVLGRSSAGTLTLSVDEKGLKYTINAPNTQTIRDLVLEPLRRGDIKESSFGFVVDNDTWDEDGEGRIVRTITKVKRLLDVSPVTYPAYEATSSAKRSLEDAKQSLKAAKEAESRKATTEQEQRDRDLFLISI